MKANTKKGGPAPRQSALTADTKLDKPGGAVLDVALEHEGRLGQRLCRRLRKGFDSLEVEGHRVAVGVVDEEPVRVTGPVKDV